MTRCLEVQAEPTANMHVVSDITSYADPNTGVLQAYISETESLRKQVAQLQAQLSTKKLKGEKKSKTKAVENNEHPAPRAEIQAHAVTSRKPKAWFCFRCGEDEHIAKSCENSVNKAAVDLKYKQLRAKQDEWKAKQGFQSNLLRFQ